MIIRTFVCPVTKKRVKMDDREGDGVAALETVTGDDALPNGWGTLRVSRVTALASLLAPQRAQMEAAAAQAREADSSPENLAQVDLALAQFGALLSQYGARRVAITWEFEVLSDEALDAVQSALGEKGLVLPAPTTEEIDQFMREFIGAGADEEGE